MAATVKSFLRVKHARGASTTATRHRSSPRHRLHPATAIPTRVATSPRSNKLLPHDIKWPATWKFHQRHKNSFQERQPPHDGRLRRGTSPPRVEPTVQGRDVAGRPQPTAGVTHLSTRWP